MSMDDTKNILIHGKPTGTIEVRPHPEEIIDVDPEILAVMNARLRGDSFERMYGSEERISKDFLIRLEKKKLSKIFGSEDQLKEAFSSLKNMKEIRQELAFESVDRAMLADYTSKRSGGELVDEVDAYASILFGSELRSKKARLQSWTSRESVLRSEIETVFGLIEAPYRASHFDVLGVSKELLSLQKPLRDLLHGGKLLPAVDEILGEFYGVAL
jgi:hypothetical protein